MEALKTEVLSKSFGKLQVLIDLSFTVSVGERVAIIGPNGAGKTTLMNILSGHLAPDSGKICMFGQDITVMPAHLRVHLGLARSFQLTTVFSNLSVVSNILVGIQGTKLSRFGMLRSMKSYTEVSEKAQKLLKAMNLWEKRDAAVSTLGYGEQRRLEIALCLASEPRLLLLDEPTAGLTVDESGEINEMIKNLGDDITVLFVAHDMDLVFGVANRIIVLYYGEIVAQGTCGKIQSDPKVREIYLGVEESGTNVGSY